MITKSATAHWEGGLKDGTGNISNESGALKNLNYTFAKRFEGKAGTNPEELIAAAHASCFSMALSKILGDAGITGAAIDTTSKVTLEADSSGFSITKIHLETAIRVPGGDKAAIEDCAQKAKAGCPVSRVLNAEITLSTKIEI